MLTETSQESYKFNQAALIERLDNAGCCPANYNIGYDHGWYYQTYGNQEAVIFQCPELTQRAREMQKTGKVYYSPVWNQYVFVPGNVED